MQLQQYPWKTSRTYLPQIMELTGGNPALLLNLSLYLTEYAVPDLANITHMIEYPSTRARLNDMRDIFVNFPLQLSQQIGMISSNNEPFCTLLSTYLYQKSSKATGLGLSYLTPNEEKMLALFISNRGKLIEKEKFALVLNKDASQFNLWSIYKAIERLKKKVFGIYEFKTVRGRGTILL